MRHREAKVPETARPNLNYRVTPRLYSVMSRRSGRAASAVRPIAGVSCALLLGLLNRVIQDTLHLPQVYLEPICDHPRAHRCLIAIALLEDQHLIFQLRQRIQSVSAMSGLVSGRDVHPQHSATTEDRQGTHKKHAAAKHRPPDFASREMASARPAPCLSTERHRIA